MRCATLAELEHHLKIEVAYRRAAANFHRTSASDIRGPRCIVTSKEVVRALRETLDGEAIDSGRIRLVDYMDGKLVRIFWFGLPVQADPLATGMIYQIQPIEC